LAQKKEIIGIKKRANGRRREKTETNLILNNLKEKIKRMLKKISK
jgi:hypothetical protein